MNIAYRNTTKGKYIYELILPYSDIIPITPNKTLEIKDEKQWYIKLDKFGILQINSGYCWDGASGGITIQDFTNRRASLVHDALYQLIREKHLDIDKRAVADKIFYETLLQDGMNKFRAWYYYQAVKVFGRFFI